MRVTMIGHSTVLIEGAGTKLITDPYFGTFGHVAYARVGKPSAGRDSFLDVDAVLVSHSHWDHTDPKFFRSLGDSTPVLAPWGTSTILRLKGVRNFQGMRPWERREIGKAAITAVPAAHIARTIGYVIELDGASAYFAGDTYHRPFMTEIARRFRIDVAMMPVATFRIPPTMGETGAVAAVRDLHPFAVIPIHLGVQPRSFLLRTKETVATFEHRLRASGLGAAIVHLAEGESWEPVAA